MRRSLLLVLILACASWSADPTVRIGSSWRGLDGEAVTLFKDGKPVLLDFWASWCMPCRAEVPHMLAFAKANPGIKVVGVNTDDPGEFDAARKFIKTLGVSYPNVVDVPDSLSGPLGVEVMPTLVLLDKHGKPLGSWVGEPQDLGRQVKKLLR